MARSSHDSSRDLRAMPFASSGPAGRVTFPGAGEAAAGVPGNTVSVATYPDYLQAQQAVDRLSDAGFPVERVTIVGEDVRLVERVLGRLTVARAALAGAGTGAWFGLLVGVLLGIFAVGAWWAVMLFAIVAGLLWGAVFGAIAHAMTGGRRDFSSASTLQAARYSLLVDAGHADLARQLLNR